MDQLSFLSEEHPAKIFPLPDLEKDFKGTEETSHWNLLNWLKEHCPSGFFGKMCLGFCQYKKDGHLEPSSGVWQNAGMGSHTGFLTLNISECHKGAGVSLLSDVLETGQVQPKYYLSQSACAGILRRANSRGRDLPDALTQALQIKAQE